MGEEGYREAMETTTAIFSQLSLQLLSLISWFHDNGHTESVAILRDLQLREKEKLQLVTKSAHLQKYFLFFSFFSADGAVPDKAS